MLLKKQTVWLLTMLSLVVVLSVYYVTSDPKQSDLAAIEKKDGEKTTGKEAAQNDNKTKVSTSEASEEEFETIRLQLQDARSKEKEDLTTRLASTDLSADEKNKLMDEMQQLTKTARDEAVIENLIKSKGYEDVLVQADGDKMKIIVKAKEHDTKAANQILRLVNEQVGNLQNVAIDFQQ